jgi:uroporphyrin-III C-methyltransferase/precorrin-2 dehydrogenase/sirohydrochlorin ferrochelatase
MTRLLAPPAPGRHVLVVGGGPVAARRAQALSWAGATVVVVAPRLCDAMFDLLVERRITWENRPVRETDLDGAWLVHVAVGNEPAEAMVRTWAWRRRLATEMRALQRQVG